jgi:transposase
MKNTTIAVDLAKSVFEIGISYRPGHVDQHHRLSRNQLSNFFAGQAPATVIMEACSSSHHWARQFVRFGHDVKLLPPFYVRPYVQRSKTDRTDVKGMLEAWRNSEIRPVPIKTEAQQQLIALHGVRSTWIATRAARINTARGILREFGIVVADGASRLPARVTELIEDAGTELPMGVRDLLNELVVEIRQLTLRIDNVERQLAAIAGELPLSNGFVPFPALDY